MHWWRIILFLLVNVMHGTTGARRAPDAEMGRTPPRDEADSAEDVIFSDQPRKRDQSKTEQPTGSRGHVLPVNNSNTILAPAPQQARPGATNLVMHQRKKRALQRSLVGPSATVSQLPADWADPSEHMKPMLDGRSRRRRLHRSDTESSSTIAPLKSNEIAERRNVSILQEQDAKVVSASTEGRTLTLLAKTAYVPGLTLFLGPYRMGIAVMQLFMGLACVAALVAFCGKSPCCAGCNFRRCSCCARLLLRIGWDKFPGFRTVVTVHSFNGYNDTSKMNKKQLFVRVSFGNIFFQTPVTDHKGGGATLEATKTMDVPQGASRCIIRLFTEGKWQNAEVGSAIIFVKKGMLDRKEGFWGERQSIKLFDAKGERATVNITFRKKHRSGGNSSDGELSTKLFTEISEDSALNLELQSHLRFWKRTRPEVEGLTVLALDQKLEILCSALCGPLREINRKGKEGGRTFLRVVYCNHSYFLDGADREEAILREKEKASKRGLRGLQQKFYWCWYESKHIPKHKPDGYIPVAAVTTVQRCPDRQDQFIVRYAHQGDKDVLVYRREGGKGLDVWIDGLEVLIKYVRKINADRKVEEETRARHESRLHQASAHWLAQQRVTLPQSTSHWKQWYEHLRLQKFGDEEIKALGKDLQARHSKR